MRSRLWSCAAQSASQVLTEALLPPNLPWLGLPACGKHYLFPGECLLASLLHQLVSMVHVSVQLTCYSSRSHVLC